MTDEWLKLYQKCAMGSVLVALVICGFSLVLENRPPIPDNEKFHEVVDLYLKNAADHLSELRDCRGRGI